MPSFKDARIQPGTGAVYFVPDTPSVAITAAIASTPVFTGFALSLLDRPTDTAGTYSIVNGISRSGHYIVGNTDTYAVSWSGTSATVLPTLGGGAIAYAVSDNGIIVGQSNDQPVFWSNGNVIALTSGSGGGGGAWWASVNTNEATTPFVSVDINQMTYTGYSDGTIVQYDATGHQIWQVRTTFPLAAMMQSNDGNIFGIWLNSAGSTYYYGLVTESGSIWLQDSVALPAAGMAMAFATDQSGSIHTLGYSATTNAVWSYFTPINQSPNRQRTLGLKLSSAIFSCDANSNYVYVGGHDTITNKTILAQVDCFAGTVNWQRSFNTATLKAITVDLNGNISVVGSVTSPGAGATTAGYIAYFNQAGTLQWQKSLFESQADHSGPIAQYFSSVTCDVNDNVFATGVIGSANTAYAADVGFDSTGNLLFVNEVQVTGSTAAYATTLSTLAQVGEQIYISPFGTARAISGNYAANSSGTRGSFVLYLPDDITLPSDASGWDVMPLAALGGSGRGYVLNSGTQTISTVTGASSTPSNTSANTSSLIFTSGLTETPTRTVPSANTGLASAITADGTVIGGQFNGLPCIWQEGVFHSLSSVAGNVSALSADGTTAFGNSNGTLGFWRGSPLSAATFTPLAAGPYSNVSAQSTTTISADGNVIAGWGDLGGHTLAMRWIKNVPTALPPLVKGADAFAYAVSGRVAAGGAFDLSGNFWPVYWVDGGQPQILPHIPGSSTQFAGEVNAISGDGRVMGGDGDNAATNDVAVVWTSAVVPPY